MSRSKKLRVLSYDVSDDKCRRRVARLLEGEGTRVQLSVFEARLNDAALKALVSRIAGVIAETDSLRVYTIGATGERHSSVLGASIPIDRDVGFWLM